MKRLSLSLAVVLLVVGAVSAPARADQSGVTILMDKRGANSWEAGRILDAAGGYTDLAKESAASNLPDKTASVKAVYKTSGGWKALKFANRLPWVAQAWSLAALGYELGSLLGKFFTGEGADLAGAAGPWHFSYESGGRYVWIQPYVNGPTYGAMRAGGGPGPGAPADYQGTGGAGVRPYETWLDFGYNWTLTSWGEGSASAISGQTQSRQIVWSATNYGTTTENGKNLYKIATPSYAVNMKFIMELHVPSQSNSRYFKVGEVDLPVYTPSNTAAVSALNNLTDVDKAKMMLSPEDGGFFDPVDPATIPTGEQVLVVNDDGTTVKRPWGGPAEGDGVTSESTPTPTPTSTPSTSPSSEPSTSPSSDPSTSPSSDPSTSPSVSPSASPDPYKQPEGVSFVEHFITKIQTKWPFDWFKDATIDAAEQDLKWVSWQGRAWEGESVEATHDLNWLKPWLSGVVALSMIGLGVVALLWL